MKKSKYMYCDNCPEHETVYDSGIVEVVIHCRKYNLTRSAGSFCVEVTDELDTAQVSK